MHGVQQHSKKTTVRAKTSLAGGFFLPQKDLLTLEDLSAVEITHILDQAAVYKESLEDQSANHSELKGKTVLNLFFEPSTRTRMSFELAEKRLGAACSNVSPSGSSLTKGESLKDMIETLEAMGPDIIVVRHGGSGVPGLMAEYTRAHVINAGDGSHAHPTQALLDLFTVREKLGSLKGIRLLIVGDLAYSRVARSNMTGFVKMGAKVTVCGPATLIPPQIERYGVSVTTDFRRALPEADVVMLLRIQKERQETLNFPSLAEYSRFYGLMKDCLPLLRKNALIMHPGPMNRGVEIDPEIADRREGPGPITLILDQVTNGIVVRMAVLKMIGSQGPS